MDGKDGDTLACSDDDEMPRRQVFDAVLRLQHVTAPVLVHKLALANPIYNSLWMMSADAFGLAKRLDTFKYQPRGSDPLTRMEMSVHMHRVSDRGFRSKTIHVRASVRHTIGLLLD